MKKVKNIKTIILTAAVLVSAQGAFATELRLPFYSVKETGLRASAFVALDGIRPLSTEVWPFRQMNIDKVHQNFSGKGQNVRICIIDSGINTSHPALTGAVVEGQNFVAGEDANDFRDGHGHGTWVASLIAGRNVDGIVGVAPEASIVVAKVFNASGSSTMQAVVEGFRYCATRSQVINMSLGGGAISEVLKAEMKLALKAGLTIIAAAGNTGDGLSYPGSDDSALAVGSTNKDLLPAYFSPVSTKISFVAPGKDIPVLKEDLTVALMSGTSLSSAYVTGVEVLRRSNGGKVLAGRTLNLPVYNQGQGIIDAELSVQK